ncbi:MMS19 nucleotide excision repair protein homolog isoform X1 [Hydra vulgaris]|uniref:MMS19 nucleotide excision repair protein n=1 Tax=Hydra vulgaris TaxID=6087 RepID=A0ABM4C2F5_HYDVU
MEQFKLLVQEQLTTGSLDNASIIEWICGKGKILDLVECLASALTDTSLEVRTKGTTLLSNIMHKYPANKMNSIEVEHFVLFYCNRLHDHHSIQPIVIYGLLGLISFQVVADSMVIKLLKSLFAEVHVQSLVQSDRKNVYNIFSNLLTTKLSVLQSISSEFLLGFIQAMDSESDPRNLLICFANSKIIIENFDFHLFCEEFFDVLSCYFPVDFTPPDNDNISVKKDDLVIGLRSCFVSTKEFAPYAIPLFVEKLSSSLLDAKKDVLITFSECLKLYDSVSVEPFLTELWLCIRKDYLLSDDKDVSPLYLNFVHEFVLCLSRSASFEYLLQLVELLIKDCLLTLKDPELSIADHCGNLVLCICNSCPATYEQMVSSLVPSLNACFEKYTSPKQRYNLLNLVLKVYSIEIGDKNVPACLVEFTDWLVPLLYNLLESENKSLPIVSLKCLSKILCHLDKFQSIDSSMFFLRTIKLPLSKLLDSEMFMCYQSMITILSDKCSELFDPLCVAKLKQNISVNNNTLIKDQCIKLLSHCALNQNYRESIVTFMVNILPEFINDEAIFGIILDVVSNILDNYPNEVSKSVVLLPLIEIFFANKCSDILMSKMVLCLSSCYLKLNAIEAGELFNLSCNLLVSEKNIDLFHLSVNKLEKLKNIVVLSRAVLSQVASMLLKNADCIPALINEFCLFISSFVNDQFACECAGIAFASIINKVSDQKIIETVINFINSCLSINPKASVLILLWLCKAVVLNWMHYTSVCLNLLLKLLQDKTTAYLVSENFQIIFNVYPKAFDHRSDSNIKILYKQHFSQIILPSLISYYNNGDDDLKPCLMTVISITLQVSPRKMFQKNLESLMPLLLHSLTSLSNYNIASTLSIIDIVLDHNKTIASDYVASLTPRLISLSSHNSMEIRICAIKCLGKISMYPTQLIYSMKDEIINGLKPRRDDKKRLVRKEVARCINLWHLLSN